jgi:hypothetical protein
MRRLTPKHWNAAWRGLRPRSRGIERWKLASAGEYLDRKRHGGSICSMRVGRCAGRETPERQRNPRRGLRDEISPRTSSAEETIERLRKPEDGTKWGLENAPRNVDALAYAAKRAETLGR